MILFIKHIDIEGPGIAGTFFHQKGFKNQIIEVYSGEQLPDDLSHIQAVISLGGPMNVYEESAYPFLSDECDFIQKVIAREIPFLGICLGSQLLANAVGIKVVRSPAKEIGFENIYLTDNGQKDPLFQGLSRELTVFQWHEDMSDVPQEAIQDVTLLAGSKHCPVQAFKIGSNAYGLQFHVEITETDIVNWTKAYLKDNVFHAREKMLEDYAACKNRLEKTADILLNNFFSIIQLHKAAI